MSCDDSYVNVCCGGGGGVVVLSAPVAEEVNDDVDMRPIFEG